MLLWSINLGKRRQKYTIGNDSFFNKWCWENWTATYNIKTGELSHTIYKNKFKMDKDLNVKPETINLLEENIGIMALCALTFVLAMFFFFLDLSSQAKEIDAKKKPKKKKKKKKSTKTKTPRQDYIKLKFCTMNKTNSNMKRQPTEWEKIFEMTYMIRG